MNLFENVITVVFQSIFHIEIHQNDIFLFFKIIFEIGVSKRFKIIKILIFNKKI